MIAQHLDNLGDPEFVAWVEMQRRLDERFGEPPDDGELEVMWEEHEEDEEELRLLDVGRGLTRKLG